MCTQCCGYLQVKQKASTVVKHTGRVEQTDAGVCMAVLRLFILKETNSC